MSRWSLESGACPGQGRVLGGEQKAGRGEPSALVPDVARPRRPTPVGQGRSGLRAAGGIWRELTRLRPVRRR